MCIRDRPPLDQRGREALLPGGDAAPAPAPWRQAAEDLARELRDLHENEAYWAHWWHATGSPPQQLENQLKTSQERKSQSKRNRYLPRRFLTAAPAAAGTGSA